MAALWFVVLTIEQWIWLFSASPVDCQNGDLMPNSRHGLLLFGRSSLR